MPICIMHCALLYPMWPCCLPHMPQLSALHFPIPRLSSLNLNLPLALPSNAPSLPPSHPSTPKGWTTHSCQFQHLQMGQLCGKKQMQAGGI